MGDSRQIGVSNMKLMFLVLCLLSPVVSLAGFWVPVDIADIKAFTNQSAHYIDIRNYSNPEKCTNAGTLVLNRDDTNNWKMVHALLMSTFVSDSKVQVRTAGCDSNGVTIIDGAMIYK